MLFGFRFRRSYPLLAIQLIVELKTMASIYFNRVGKISKGYGSALTAIVYVCFLLAGSLIHPAFGAATSSGSTTGESFTVFGPQTYVRQTGKPIQVVASFSMTDLTTSYTLKIYNGGSPQSGTTGERVSSAEIDLNGKLIFGPSDFNQQVNQLSLPVALLASNTISVQLQGKPGAVLVLEIIGKRNTPPPQLTSVSPASGSTTGGTTINISGDNFLKGATARLGGAIASSTTVLNSSSISALTPSHAPGVVDVSVTNPDGQTALLVGAYTYLPPPQLTSIAPVSGFTTGGTTINISGMNFQTGATVRFGNVAATSTTVVNSNSINAVTPSHGLGIVDVSVANPDSQTNTLANAYRYVFPPPTIAVTSIMSGAIVSGDRLSLSGTIIGPDNTGITVNGVVASIVNGMFYVNNVILLPGINTITVKASTLDGQQVTETLTVTSSGPSPFRVTVSPQSGVAPLKTSFTVTNLMSSAIQSIAVDFNGDGAIDFSTTDRTTPVEFTYVTPGVYQPTIFVTDSQGATSNKTLTVVVLDAEQMDAFFKSIWDALNSDLVAGDLLDANRYLNLSAQTKYLRVFQTLLPHMGGIVASYSPLQRVSISEDIGEYAVNRTYQGQNRLYLIYFLKGADGVWRVDAM